jgi:hypothetical protein
MQLRNVCLVSRNSSRVSTRHLEYSGLDARRYSTGHQTYNAHSILPKIGNRLS